MAAAKGSNASNAGTADNASNASSGASGESTASMTPDEEVAARSADVAADSSSDHEKVFVLLKREWDACDQEAIHRANVMAVRQYMASQGLRTDQDVEFVGEEAVEPDAQSGTADESVALRYRVAAVPSRDATYEQGTMTVPEAQDLPSQTAEGQ